MNRFASYIGIAIAFLFGVFIVVFSDSVITERPPVPATSTSSSTLSVLPNPALERSTASTSVQQTVSIQEKAPPKVVPVARTPIKSVPVSALVPLPPDTSALLDASATALRAALVNIICYAPVGTKLRSISGSGIFINPKGIILTNAHIAQYFLLADRTVSCTIRSGSPATDSYDASLIYLPSIWINANAKVLTETNPSGTGEYDFAFLAVTKSASRDALPTTFPFIPLAISPPNTGTPVVIASYGAQFLESSQIQSSLFPTIVFGSVKDIFTFASTTIDVLALGGSVAAQEGSSGGGVASGNGELVGTITTSTIKGSTDTRALDAITASYIRAEYANETGSALDILLAQSTSTAIADFAPKMSALEAIITAQLSSP